MISKVSPGSVSNLLTLVSQANKSLPVTSGTIIKAMVSAINNDGNAVLRILSGGDKQNIQGTLLKAHSQTPLRKGQTIFLEVMGNKTGMQMKLVGDSQRAAAEVADKGNVHNLVAFVNQANKSLSVKPGTIIRAMVAAINNDGNAVLRILSSGGNMKNIQGSLIHARARTTLSRGQTVLLEVMSGNAAVSGKTGVIMKLLGDRTGLSGSAQQKIPVRLFNMLAQLPQTSLSDVQFRSILTLIRSLPPQIRALLTEFNGLETLFVNSKTLHGKTVHSFIESSAQLKLPVRFLHMLNLLSDSRLSRAEIKPLLNALNSIPEQIKTAIPEFNKLEAVLSASRQINGALLKAIVQSEEHTDIPIKALNIMASLSNARMASSEFQSLLKIIRSIPDSIKVMLPELTAIENMIGGSQAIDGKTLRAFVASSGVALETQIKLAVLSDPDTFMQNLAALQAGGDLKSLLMKVKRRLIDQNIISRLKQAGLKSEELSQAADKFISHIEFFQFTSRVHNMFCTFLPVLWDGFNDGELLFKKGRHNEKPSYTCDVNLDLSTLGKLSISVTTVNREFYVTFHVDRKETESLVKSAKVLLQERFQTLGLPLKALGINHRKDIFFGSMQQKEISMKA